MTRYEGFMGRVRKGLSKGRVKHFAAVGWIDGLNLNLSSKDG